MLLYTRLLSKTSILTQTPATISTQDAPSLAPPPRVGSASTTLNGKTYLFSGRGGVDMAPVSENGYLWSYDHTRQSWSSIAPAGGSFQYLHFKFGGDPIFRAGTQINFIIGNILAAYR